MDPSLENKTCIKHHQDIRTTLQRQDAVHPAHRAQWAEVTSGLTDQY
jgi:hypothetical protein